MTERILGPEGSPRRRRFLWVPMLLIACLALFVIGSAQAVHDEGFQLDGDVTSACPPNNALPLCTSSQKDWADLFTVTDTGGPPATTEAVTNSSVIDAVNGPFTNATFTRDFETGPSTAACNASGLTSLSTNFCTGDDTTFATGSKDTLDISGWACNHDNNVNSKIDIMNAYAAAYTNPTPDADGVHHKLLYFGMEKNKDNGTNDVGFWFLQGNASCSAPPNTHPSWTGLHTVGDVLVVSEFTNGGGVSNITAYRWVGGSSPLTQIGTAGDCKASLGGDSMCATTNSGAKPFNTAINTPWLTADATLGVGKTGKIVPPDFFEGGIDLTQAFKDSGGATVPSCFNTFIGDTRASNVTGSTLFDYARGQLGQCSSGLSTQQNNASSPSIGTGVVSSGTDTATLNITGSTTWNGQLTWYLCGPGSTSCDSHGVQVTSTAVHSSDASHVYTSGSAFLTSAGSYCWHAHFEPDGPSKTAGINPADDDGTNECFTVTAATPSLPTSAGCGHAAPCVLGVDTLSDTATLSGTASEPGTGGPGGDAGAFKSIYLTSPSGLTAAGGSITWVLFGPGGTPAGCDPNNTKATSPASAAVSGDATYGPTSYKPVVADGVGQYTFVANYGGDGVNTNAAPTNTCASPGANETVTISGSVGSASKQGWLPNDRITVTATAGTTLSGSVMPRRASTDPMSARKSLTAIFAVVMSGSAAACARPRRRARPPPAG